MCIGGRFAIVWPCIQFVCVGWLRLCVCAQWVRVVLLCQCVCVLSGWFACVGAYMCGHGVGVIMWQMVAVVCRVFVFVCCLDGVRGGGVGVVVENESELVPKTNQKPIRKHSKKPRFARC